MSGFRGFMGLLYDGLDLWHAFEVQNNPTPFNSFHWNKHYNCRSFKVCVLFSSPSFLLIHCAALFWCQQRGFYVANICFIPPGQRTWLFTDEKTLYFMFSEGTYAPTEHLLVTHWGKISGKKSWTGWNVELLILSLRNWGLVPSQVLMVVL